MSADYVNDLDKTQHMHIEQSQPSKTVRFLTALKFILYLLIHLHLNHPLTCSAKTFSLHQINYIHVYADIMNCDFQGGKKRIK